MTRRRSLQGGAVEAEGPDAIVAQLLSVLASADRGTDMLELRRQVQISIALARVNLSLSLGSTDRSEQRLQKIEITEGLPSAQPAQAHDDELA